MGPDSNNINDNDNDNDNENASESDNLSAVDWYNRTIKRKKEISFPDFVHTFNYYSEQDAHNAFTSLISSSLIPQRVRTALVSHYNIWRRNSGAEFWASRNLSSQISITTKRTATEVVSGTEHISKKYIQETSGRAKPFEHSGLSSFLKEFDLENGQEGRSRSPSERHLARSVDSLTSSTNFAALGQQVTWIVKEIDLVKEFQEFRTSNMSPYSLALDGIADLTQESAFSAYLEKGILGYARRVAPSPDIYERWPTLLPILDRVFRSNNYDEVAEAVRTENMKDPVAAYLFTVVMAYYHYFKFRSEVPEDINEREGFAGLTWVFLQTSLTMYDVESRYLEVFIKATDDRKNQEKNLLLETKEPGQFADAVATFNDQQLLLVEAAHLHNPEMKKRRLDEFKLVRAMRDCWIRQVRITSNINVPHRGLAVYGCASFKDEVKLLRLDYRGVFRLQQFDFFVIPLRKHDFGVKMRSAVVSCLQLAARVHEEIVCRNKIQGTSTLDYYTRVSLADAVRMIEKTTSSPSHIKKRK
ncbi:hypothetical protein EDD11_002740 [Mortierella claussenii]|nr:hypothetical protein EDD11_002740 [Mortierella claussenii]